MYSLKQGIESLLPASGGVDDRRAQLRLQRGHFKGESAGFSVVHEVQAYDTPFKMRRSGE